MKRTIKLKHAVNGMYAAVVVVEALAIVAGIASIVTGNFDYMVLAIVNFVGAVVLDEMLKAYARGDSDRYDAYRDAVCKPLPGPAYRIARAVLKRRRPQHGWLRF